MHHDAYDDKSIVNGIISNDSSLIGHFLYEECSKFPTYTFLKIFDGNINKKELISELYPYLAQNRWYKVRQFDYRSKLMTWIFVVVIRFLDKKHKELIGKSTFLHLNDETWQEYGTGSSINRKMDIRATLQKTPNTRYRTVIEALDLRKVYSKVLAEEMNTTVDNLYYINCLRMCSFASLMGRKEDYYD